VLLNKEADRTVLHLLLYICVSVCFSLFHFFFFRSILSLSAIFMLKQKCVYATRYYYRCFFHVFRMLSQLSWLLLYDKDTFGMPDTLCCEHWCLLSLFYFISSYLRSTVAGFFFSSVVHITFWQKLFLVFLHNFIEL